MRRLVGLFTLVVLLTLTACSAAGSSTEDMAAGSDGGAQEMPDDVDAAHDEGTAGDASGEVGSPPTAAGDRQFVVSGSVTLTVEDVRRAVRDAAMIVERVGGHVQERVEEGDGEGSGSAFLVVRIPSEEVTATLEQLEQLGTVTDTRLTSTEVTAQVRDLEARIRALKVSVARLEDLLARAGSISDIVQAEQMLTERQADLESLESQRAGIAAQVDMATFRLDIWTEESEPEPEPTGFWAGLVTGWNALVTTLAGALQVLGVLLPWLIFAALVTAVVVPVTRRLKLRRAATAPPSAPYPGPAVPFGSQPAPAGPPGSAPAPVPPAAPTGAPAPPAASAPVPDPAAPPPAPPAETAEPTSPPTARKKPRAPKAAPPEPPVAPGEG